MGKYKILLNFINKTYYNENFYYVIIKVINIFKNVYILF